MVRVAMASILGVSMTVGGCRACGVEKSGERDATAMGPTMPPGMLVPTDAPSAQASPPTDLRVARHVKEGAFVELQIARPGDRESRRDFERWRDDSLFVSLPAMTLLHEPFARALPGFDLFLPRLFGGAALAILAAELDAFAGRASSAAREIAELARVTAAKGDALWVLGI
jgi:hypothetical protein